MSLPSPPASPRDGDNVKLFINERVSEEKSQNDADEMRTKKKQSQLEKMIHETGLEVEEEMRMKRVAGVERVKVMVAGDDDGS